MRVSGFRDFVVYRNDESGLKELPSEKPQGVFGEYRKYLMAYNVVFCRYQLLYLTVEIKGYHLKIAKKFSSPQIWSQKAFLAPFAQKLP